MLPVKLSHPVKSCGVFGAKRKYDIHAGLDLYCSEGTDVYPILSGVISGIFQFTGEAVNTPWWEDTFAILVASNGYDILYGEVDLSEGLVEGGQVPTDKPIGKVKRVLKKDKGVTPTSMLHLEVWKNGTFIKDFVWHYDAVKPDGLVDPTGILDLAKVQYWVIKLPSGYSLQDSNGAHIKFFSSAIDCKSFIDFVAEVDIKYLSEKSSPIDKLIYYQQTGRIFDEIYVYNLT